MEAALNDVQETVAPVSASAEVVESATTEEPSGESLSNVNATDETQSTEVETLAEVDPLEGLPTTEELQQQAAQKVPYAEALARLRTAYETVKPQLDSYKPLDAWKTLADTVGDPALVQSAHELVSAIHSPDPNNPTGFTSRPFLEKLETESPGSVDQLFADTLSFQVPDAQGQPSTVVRELVKSWGLDPDRIEDYRNIDTLRASGVVTAEDLSAIPEKFHAAFKALSPAQREDILRQKETDALGQVSYPAFALDYLQDKTEALEARTWREKEAAEKTAQVEQQRVEFEQQVSTAVDQDFSTEVKGLHDSIHQTLASAVKFSSDSTTNDLEIGKVMSTLATLQHPYYRFVAENALKAVGVTVDPKFDEWANRWAERREAFVRFSAQKDSMQAGRAKSEATHAYQQVLLRLNDYALKLAKPTLNRLATDTEQVNNTLAATAARYVPNGSGQGQQGAANPYMNNPHPVGSPEWSSYYRNLDKEFKLNGASLLGGN